MGEGYGWGGRGGDRHDWDDHRRFGWGWGGGYYGGGYYSGGPYYAEPYYGGPYYDGADYDGYVTPESCDAVAINGMSCCQFRDASGGLLARCPDGQTYAFQPAPPPR